LDDEDSLIRIAAGTGRRPKFDRSALLGATLADSIS
jgi:hypothetical protein